MIFFEIYVAGTALMALRLAWKMIFRLDADAWQHRKADIWMEFSVCSIIWPLFLVRPSAIFNADTFFEDRSASIERRPTPPLEEEVPPCGEVIHYIPRHSPEGEALAEFWFDAE